ncbi:PAS domain-containing sensor histidine kinase [Clostridium lacusfryxellense]|uniref:PAS domain-containing sensor histidine kinase n=1 Tax=Clostridium lacusfryxellense TaxID=205328 RepID=UPI001C0AF8A2|nr:PAS domain-containing sensor histidine kinase [Clostridium lacusfryxellense]MBU3110279.1 PAS domain-containing protein [Clostridium lacusfryxellense]
MEYTFSDKIIEPYFYSCDGIITDVNKEFIDFTGFEIDELLGKSLTEIGHILKINSQKHLDNISSNYSGYIFTKSFSAREVDITLLHIPETNGNVYTLAEKPNSRLDEKLVFIEQLFEDDTSGFAVYSAPDLILLKSNQKYVDLIDSPFNIKGNSIGLFISNIISDFVGSESEFVWNSILQTKKSSYIKEIRFNNSKEVVTYWNFTQTTILENGKIKYIFETASEVTERFFENQTLQRNNRIIEEQKQQLEQKNIQLISILENLSEGVILTDNIGNFIMSNTEAKRLVYQSDNITALGKVFETSKLFDMKGNEMPYENLPGIRALRGEEVKNIKVHIKHPNNEYFLEISSIPIYNSFGDLTNVISCFHDITDTIKQSGKIEEQKNQLEAIIENISDGISIFDNKGKYISFNKSERKMFFPYYEYNAQTNDRYYVYIDKTSDSYNQAMLYDINGDEIALENTPIYRVMRGEKFKNMRMVAKFPHKTLHIDISGTPIYDSEGKFTLGVLCSQDMTAYVKREEAMRNQYQFLNRMVDTFDLPVVRISCPDLKIMDINKKAFNIIKLLKPDIISMSQLAKNTMNYLFKTYNPLELGKCLEHINEVIKEKKTKYLNKKAILLNGNQIYWNIIFEPIFEVNGEIQEIIIIVIDVTSEVASNMVMEKALKLQGEFLVNISHELKTPLNIIFATAQLFALYCNSGSLDDNKNSIIKYIDSIKQNSYRLSKLINNIVDLSKIEAGFYNLNISNNNIVVIVEDIVVSVTNFTNIKGLNIIFDTDIEEKIIACDPEAIDRIVLNLISNSIKFSNVGDEIFVDIKDKNEFVEISVKDTGIGIKDNDLEMIFDRFKQVDKSLSKNSEGTGIGLSLVKSIVELHGGSIYVESEFGKGSKFTVKLPSKKVINESNLYINKVPIKNENIQVELSDIY